jgi:hypothetical protein
MKKNLFITELDDNNVGMIVVGKLILIEAIKSLVGIKNINHYSVMSPKHKTEIIVLEKTDLFETIRFHNETMEEIPSNIDKYILNNNIELKNIFAILSDLINDDCLDFYILITTDNEELDVTSYMSSINLTPIVQYMDFITNEYYDTSKSEKDKPKRTFEGKKVLFQITANTGETLGLPIDGWEEAKCRAEYIISDEKHLQELCPDTDISVITSLHLEPTTDY